MERILKIIEIIALDGMIAYCITCFWEIKSKVNITFKVMQMILATVIFALQIPRVVLSILLNKPYGSIILLLVLWVLNIAINAFFIGVKLEESSAHMNITIELLNNTDEWCQEDSKEKNDDQ